MPIRSRIGVGQPIRCARPTAASPGNGAASYVVGGAAVTLTPAGLGGGHWEGFLVLVALLTLIHFYCGLAERQNRDVLHDGNRIELAGPARAFLYSVLGIATVVFILGWTWREPIDLLRFSTMLALIMILAALKVRLPGMPGTMSLGFVVLLACVVELSLWEVSLLAAVGALVQSLWFPAHRPKPVQVAFSAASMVLATAAAFAAVRLMFAPALNGFLGGQLVVASLFLYGTNTLLVSSMVCLAQHQSLAAIWRRTHFWIFPYYVVGATAAAIVVSTSRTHGWIVSLLVIPTTVLVYVSYRSQVYQQVAK